MLAAARDAGLAHAARDDGGVRGHAAARRENALGGVHAVDVLGARLDAHQHDIVPLRLELLGFVGVEDDLVRRRRPGDAGSPVPITVRSAFGSIVGCRSWSSEPGSTRVTASLLA